MLELYCGDGKGKTTAAFGLALRAAGRGKRVVIAQFLKAGDTGERAAVRSVPGIELLPVPETVKFSRSMTEKEREEAAAFSRMTLGKAAGSGADVIVLDEACAAVSCGLLTAEELTAALDSLPPETEVVVTGRDPCEELVRRADYITEMCKRRHPYDRGIAAREGIEY